MKYIIFYLFFLISCGVTIPDNREKNNLTIYVKTLNNYQFLGNIDTIILTCKGDGVIKDKYLPITIKSDKLLKYKNIDTNIFILNNYDSNLILSYKIDSNTTNIFFIADDITKTHFTKYNYEKKALKNSFGLFINGSTNRIANKCLPDTFKLNLVENIKNNNTFYKIKSDSLLNLNGIYDTIFYILPGEYSFIQPNIYNTNVFKNTIIAINVKDSSNRIKINYTNNSTSAISIDNSTRSVAINDIDTININCTGNNATASYTLHSDTPIMFNNILDTIHYLGLNGTYNVIKYCNKLGNYRNRIWVTSSCGSTSNIINYTYNIVPITSSISINNINRNFNLCQPDNFTISINSNSKSATFNLYADSPFIGADGQPNRTFYNLKKGNYNYTFIANNSTNFINKIFAISNYNDTTNKLLLNYTNNATANISIDNINRAVNICTSDNININITSNTNNDIFTLHSDTALIRNFIKDTLFKNISTGQNSFSYLPSTSKSFFNRIWVTSSCGATSNIITYNNTNNATATITLDNVDRAVNLCQADRLTINISGNINNSIYTLFSDSNLLYQDNIFKTLVLDNNTSSISLNYLPINKNIFYNRIWVTSSCGATSNILRYKNTNNSTSAISIDNSTRSIALNDNDTIIINCTGNNASASYTLHSDTPIMFNNILDTIHYLGLNGTYNVSKFCNKLGNYRNRIWVTSSCGSTSNIIYYTYNIVPITSSISINNINRYFNLCQNDNFTISINSNSKSATFNLYTDSPFIGADGQPNRTFYNLKKGNYNYTFIANNYSNFINKIFAVSNYNDTSNKLLLNYNNNATANISIDNINRAVNICTSDNININITSNTNNDIFTLHSDTALIRNFIKDTLFKNISTGQNSFSYLPSTSKSFFNRIWVTSSCGATSNIITYNNTNNATATITLDNVDRAVNLCQADRLTINISGNINNSIYTLFSDSNLLYQDNIFKTLVLDNNTSSISLNYLPINKNIFYNRIWVTSSCGATSNILRYKNTNNSTSAISIDNSTRSIALNDNDTIIINCTGNNASASYTLHSDTPIMFNNILDTIHYLGLNGTYNVSKFCNKLGNYRNRIWVTSSCGSTSNIIYYTYNIVPITSSISINNINRYFNLCQPDNFTISINSNSKSATFNLYTDSSIIGADEQPNRQFYNLKKGNYNYTFIALNGSNFINKIFAVSNYNDTTNKLLLNYTNNATANISIDNINRAINICTIDNINISISSNTQNDRFTLHTDSALTKNFIKDTIFNNISSGQNSFSFFPSTSKSFFNRLFVTSSCGATSNIITYNNTNNATATITLDNVDRAINLCQADRLTINISGNINNSIYTLFSDSNLSYQDNIFKTLVLDNNTSSIALNYQPTNKNIFYNRIWVTSSCGATSNIIRYKNSNNSTSAISIDNSTRSVAINDIDTINFNCTGNNASASYTLHSDTPIMFNNVIDTIHYLGLNGTYNVSKFCNKLGNYRNRIWVTSSCGSTSNIINYTYNIVPITSSISINSINRNFNLCQPDNFTISINSNSKSATFNLYADSNIIGADAQPNRQFYNLKKGNYNYTFIALNSSNFINNIFAVSNYNDTTNKLLLNYTNNATANITSNDNIINSNYCTFSNYSINVSSNYSNNDIFSLISDSLLYYNGIYSKKHILGNAGNYILQIKPKYPTSYVGNVFVTSSCGATSNRINYSLNINFTKPSININKQNTNVYLNQLDTFNLQIIPNQNDNSIYYLKTDSLLYQGSNLNYVWQLSNNNSFAILPNRLGTFTNNLKIYSSCVDTIIKSINYNVYTKNLNATIELLTDPELIFANHFVETKLNITSNLNYIYISAEENFYYNNNFYKKDSNYKFDITPNFINIFYFKFITNHIDYETSTINFKINFLNNLSISYYKNNSYIFMNNGLYSKNGGLDSFKNIGFIFDDITQGNNKLYFTDKYTLKEFDLFNFSFNSNNFNNFNLYLNSRSIFNKDTLIIGIFKDTLPNFFEDNYKIPIYFRNSILYFGGKILSSLYNLNSNTFNYIYNTINTNLIYNYNFNDLNLSPFIRTDSLIIKDIKIINNIIYFSHNNQIYTLNEDNILTLYKSFYVNNFDSYTIDKLYFFYNNLKAIRFVNKSRLLFNYENIKNEDNYFKLFLIDSNKFIDNIIDITYLNNNKYIAVGYNDNTLHPNIRTKIYNNYKLNIINPYNKEDSFISFDDIVDGVIHSVTKIIETYPLTKILKITNKLFILLDIEGNIYISTNSCQNFNLLNKINLKNKFHSEFFIKDKSTFSPLYNEFIY